ncbi:MAG: EAL domain-containing protein [Proteobacteria bacterium]|nr:EAL domain-containing protein [Pseudomonadota bacterium]
MACAGRRTRCRIARCADDFGTSYSSLSYLQSFPFDKIKIGRVFVSELESSARNASLVKAVTSMGKSLNMRVAAARAAFAPALEITRPLRQSVAACR